MKNKKMFLIVLLAFVLLIGGAYVLYNNLSSGAQPQLLAVKHTPGNIPAPTVDPADAQQTAHPEQDGEQPSQADEPHAATGSEEPELVTAPDFRVFDKDGNDVYLSDFRGKPVILNFWASWCDQCKKGMPDFEQAYAQYGEDVHIAMINLTDGKQETLESASAFIEENEYSFPVYYDTDYEAMITYGVMSIPRTFFIDAEGNLITYAQGPIGVETIKIGIDMILTADSE